MSKEGGGPPPYSGSGDDRALVCLDSFYKDSGQLGSRFLYDRGEIWWIESFDDERWLPSRVARRTSFLCPLFFRLDNFSSLVRSKSLQRYPYDIFGSILFSALTVCVDVEFDCEKTLKAAFASPYCSNNKAAFT
ncbi:hypothetical protein BT69DRAFT_1284564 [Atractiella rhizophila]|nr:hypothetical protein BT69DRAFT_1284564 [Atractiella rhizophila]